MSLLSVDFTGDRRGGACTTVVQAGTCHMSLLSSCLHHSGASRNLPFEGESCVCLWQGLGLRIDNPQEAVPDGLSRPSRVI